MRRRWKRRLLWAAVILGLLLLAIPATVGQGMAAIRRPKSSRERGPLGRTPSAGSGDLTEADQRDDVFLGDLAVVELAQEPDHLLDPPDLGVVVLDLAR